MFGDNYKRGEVQSAKLMIEELKNVISEFEEGIKKYNNGDITELENNFELDTAKRIIIYLGSEILRAEKFILTKI